MSELLATNSPKQSRKFKRQLFTEAQLRQNAQIWSSQLLPLFDSYADKKISAGETAALYMLVGLNQLYPDRWIVGPNILKNEAQQSAAFFDFWPCQNNRILKWLRPDITIFDVISSYSFAGVRLAAREVLLQWMKNEISLQLCSHVPTALEMLQWQSDGIRPVTAVYKENELSQIVHDERDALSFFLHDLGHASQFFSNPTWFDGQKQIYKILLHAHEAGIFELPILKNSGWDKKFEYLIADLNTHPEHFWAVFWATIRECFAAVGARNAFEAWQARMQTYILQH